MIILCCALRKVQTLVRTTNRRMDVNCLIMTAIVSVDDNCDETAGDNSNCIPNVSEEAHC